MALMKKYIKKEFVQIPNTTARAVEAKDQNPISLEALGLITNLWSYPETWDLHKTELYKRFAKNKKTSVTNTWDELVKAKYIIEFKYRNGRKWEYVYIYQNEPFTDEEIEEIMAQSVDEYGVDSTSDFQQLKINSSKCTVQNEDIIKKDKRKTVLKKNNINTLEEEEGASPSPKPSNRKIEFKTDFSTDEIAEAYSFISPQMQDTFETFEKFDIDPEFQNRLVCYMYMAQIKYFSFTEFKELYNELSRNNFKDSKGKTIIDPALYLIRGLIMSYRTKTNSDSAAYLLEKAKKVSGEKTKKEENTYTAIPFYNWLEEK